MSVALNVSTPSAIYDYATLKTEWARRMDRDDLDAHFPQFVQLTEAFLRRRLRALDMEVITQIATSSETTDLPTDMLSIRSIYVEGSPDQPLRNVSPSAIAQEFSGEAGQPAAYTRINNQIRLAPPPESEMVLEVVYIAKFVPLTETSANNWLIDEHPDVYFYGCLAQACDYIDDERMSSKYGNLFVGMADELARARNADRWGSRRKIPSGIIQSGGRC